LTACHRQQPAHAAVRRATRTLAVVLLAAGFGAGTPPAEAKTTVIRWSPFDADGTLRAGLAATPAFGGDCFTGSFVVNGAYRCIAGHLLRDPCFPDPTVTTRVLCVRDPFTRGVVRLRVTGHLDNGFNTGPGVAWALRLAGGQRCSAFAGGATSADSAGRRANYACSGRMTVLWGNPIRRSGTWRIRLSHSFTPGPERLVAIRTAYIGRV
jgi:hypothetical protein